MSLLSLGASGCGRRGGADPKPAGESRPQQEAKEPEKQASPVAGTVRDLDLTLTDARGVIVARVKAQTGAVGRTGVDTGTAGAVQRAVATLYEQGKASAVITGDQIAADPATRAISGKGNVVARSLVQPGSPTVRADAMTWRPDQHTIRGQGNVVLTRQPNVRVTGDRFEADTRLRRLRILNDAPPQAAAR